MKRFFILFFCVFSVLGCSDEESKYDRFDKMQGEKRRVEFKIDDYKPYMKKGRGRIKGQLCIRQDNGKKKCLADQIVLLNPATDYSAEWYERYWKGGELLESAHDEALRRSRLIRTDKRGNFVFFGLPAGEYYIGAVACPYAGRNGEKTKPFNYQRWGTKVSIGENAETTEAILEKVLEYDR